MTGRTYMVVHFRRDHSFRVPRPDLTLRIGTPNACNGCHRDRSPAWAAQAVERWYGPSRSSREHYGEAIEAGRRTAAGAAASLSAVAADADQPAIVRATAVGLLEPFVDPPMVPSIERWLSDPDPLVRSASLTLLEPLPPKDKGRLAAPLLRDPVRTVRVDAGRALAGLPAEALPPGADSFLAAAIAELEATQALDADRPQGHLNLGILHGRRGDGAGAAREYEAALRLEPAFVPAAVNLADVLRAQGRDAAGEALLRRTLALVPDSADLHEGLGLLLVRGHRMDEALRELGRASTLAPHVPRYAYVLGVALASSGQRQKGIAALTLAQRRFTGDRDILVALIGALRESGDIGAARERARQLRDLFPRDPDAQRLYESLRNVSE